MGTFPSDWIGSAFALRLLQFLADRSYETFGALNGISKFEFSHTLPKRCFLFSDVVFMLVHALCWGAKEIVCESPTSIMGQGSSIEKQS